jgi:hypothetical protein
MLDDYYITLEVSGDGTAMVQQTFALGDPNVPFLRGDRSQMSTAFQIADLNDRGAEFTVEFVGTLLLLLLPPRFPVLSKYSQLHPDQERIKELNQPRLDVSTVRIPTRPAHLRTRVACMPDRLLIQRYDATSATAEFASVLSLPRLALSGPQGAIQRVGTTLLNELAALHRDVFAPFPALHV